MKKVLLISHYPPPSGGIASWTKRLLQIGLPRGWEISHINLNTINGRDPFQNTKRNFKDEYVRCRNIWRQEIDRLKNDKDISVVHTCIPCTAFGMMRETITGLIAKRYGKKFILHCRCTVPNVVHNTFQRLLFRILGSLCDGIIVLNTRSYDFARKYSKAQVSLIPNFVVEDELVSCEDASVKEQLRDVIYVGGVTVEKGCDTILAAAKQLPDMKFHLVGGPSPELKAAEKPENVILYGDQKKEFVQEILPTADVFLFLSRYWGEGFSNALAEAMAAGLPCVVTDWAANADMIEGQGGVVIPQQNAQALVQALDSLREQSVRQSMRDWNVNKVKTTYLAPVVLEQMTKFYEQVIGLTEG